MIISIFVFFVVWTIHVHCMVTFMSQKRPQRLITKRIGNRTLNSRDQKIVSCLDTKILDIGWILLKTSFVNFRRMQIAAV